MDLTGWLMQALDVEGMPVAGLAAVGYTDLEGHERVAIALDGRTLSLRGTVEAAYELAMRQLSGAGLEEEDDEYEDEE